MKICAAQECVFLQHHKTPWVVQQRLVAGPDIENNREDSLWVETSCCHVQVKLPWGKHTLVVIFV